MYELTTEIDMTKVWKTYRKRPTEALRNDLIERFMHIVRFNAERIHAKTGFTTTVSSKLD